MTKEINNNKFLTLCKKRKCFSLVPFSEKEFKNFKYKNPLDFFRHFWTKYEKFKKKYKKKKNKEINNSYNGDALEIILAFLFTMEKIQIEKMDEEVDVKYVKPDFILIGKDNEKFFISAKVSIRERWKQADWEAIKYKEKHPNDNCILIMNDKSEYPSLKNKLKFLTLDKVCLANSNNINELINQIKNKSLPAKF